MKKALCLLMVLLVSALAVSAFALEPGTYTWREFSIEVTDVQKGGMFAPADMTADDYCVNLSLVADESLRADDALMHEMYAEAFLMDAEGNTYAPGAWLSRSDGDSFLYAIPKTVEIEELIVAFGGEAGAADSAEESAAE